MHGSYGERYSASSFYCVNENGEKKLNNHGDEGRSNWIFNTDVGVMYSPEWSSGLTLQATIYNVLNTQRPDTFNQEKDLDRDNPEVNPSFLNLTDYQSPRYVQFTAKYQF